jgi:SagB-type dehydrogenase family enzyme
MARAELPRHLISGLTGETALWELFHDNSKTGRYDSFPQPDFITMRMDRMLESLAYEQYPEIDLPRARTEFELSLAETMEGRVSARGMAPVRLTLQQLGTLLHYCYGVTRKNEDTEFPRPFRVVPSGGALYPLEIYFHSTRIEELESGLYHYNPMRNSLRFLRYGDDSRRLSDALVQRNLALDTSLLIFITALFDRSAFKYGDRGYRFALLEAGHVAQNLALTATAMKLNCLTIGGYADRQIDDLLGIDGVSHSAIYMVGIGGDAPTDTADGVPMGA